MVFKSRKRRRKTVTTVLVVYNIPVTRPRAERDDSPRYTPLASVILTSLRSISCQSLSPSLFFLQAKTVSKSGFSRTSVDSFPVPKPKVKVRRLNTSPAPPSRSWKRRVAERSIGKRQPHRCNLSKPYSISHEKPNNTVSHIGDCVTQIIDQIPCSLHIGTYVWLHTSTTPGAGSGTTSAE